MSSDDNVRLNEWSRRHYFDPCETLVKLRELELLVENSALPARARALRTNELKRYREWREAALFCYGLGVVTQVTVSYATVEAEDYDVVARWRRDEVDLYAPIQIKELVPSHTNPRASLEDLLQGLRKYPCSDQTVVAVHVERREPHDLSAVQIPKLHLGALWVFGAVSEDQSRWLLYGDMLSNPEPYEFTYPT